MNKGKIDFIDIVAKKPDCDFHKWTRGIDCFELPDKCQKCKFPLICLYADMGTTEFCDVYNHVCTNPKCGFLQKAELNSVAGTSRDAYGPDPCPICKRIIRQ